MDWMSLWWLLSWTKGPLARQNGVDIATRVVRTRGMPRLLLGMISSADYLAPFLDDP